MLSELFILGLAWIEAFVWSVSLHKTLLMTHQCWQHPSPPVACSFGPGRLSFGPGGALYFSAWSHQWLDLCTHQFAREAWSVFFLFAFVSCLYLSTLVELSTTRISCSVLKIFPCSDGGRTVEHTVISSWGCSAIFALSGLTSPLFFLKYKGLLTWSLCIRGTAMGRTFKTAILRHRLDFCVLPGTQIMCFIWKH